MCEQNTDRKRFQRIGARGECQGANTKVLQNKEKRNVDTAFFSNMFIRHFRLSGDSIHEAKRK